MTIMVNVLLIVYSPVRNEFMTVCLSAADRVRNRTLFEREVRTMEKITKEELMKKLNLTEEELEKVVGGLSCEEQCLFLYDPGDPRLISCRGEC